MAAETDVSVEQGSAEKSGGSGKYALLGLLLMLGAGGLWYFTKPKAEAKNGTAPVAVAAAAPAPTQQFDDSLVIPEEVAPTPEAAPTHAVAPRPAAGDWSCSGELAVSEVRSTISANQNQVRSCYERRLRSDPMLSGNLQVRMKVGASGSVEAVQVGGSLRDSEVTSCVRERVRQWHFAAPTGGRCATIAAPFTLNPRQ